MIKSPGRCIAVLLGVISLKGAQQDEILHIKNHISFAKAPELDMLGVILSTILPLTSYM